MTELHRVSQLLGLLNRGQFEVDLNAAQAKLILMMQDEAGAKGKAKGRITVTLDYIVEGVHVDITPTLTVKEPPIKRQTEVFFTGREGKLSLEHPKQLSFGLAPAEDRETA